MTLRVRWGERKGVIISWGVLAFGVMLLAARSYYLVSMILLPFVLNGSGPSPSTYIPTDQAFELLIAGNVISVIGSFVLLVASMLHLWTRPVPANRRLAWTLIAVVGLQPGLLAYWVFNVFPSLFQRRDDGRLRPQMTDEQTESKTSQVHEVHR